MGEYTLEFTTAEAITEGSAVFYQTGSNDIVNADAVTERVLGIAQEAAASGAKCSVQVAGVVDHAKVDGSGSEVFPGDRLSAGTVDGIMIKHDEAASTVCAGIALDGTDSATGRIRVLLSSERAAT